MLELVSKTLGIPIREVYTLNSVEFLNWWAYKKEEADEKERLHKKWTKN